MLEPKNGTALLSPIKIQEGSNWVDGLKKSVKNFNVTLCLNNE